jgi:hypothetical protein
MKVTLDHNCLIHLERGGQVDNKIRASLSEPAYQCFVVNVGASEMQRFGVSDEDLSQPVRISAERRRIIPSTLKLEVWQRDAGKCAICSATDELHFDHIVPFSKGGTSVTAANVQLLCARHNLASPITFNDGAT